ncbi:hypothetical protein ACLNGM_02490 [Aureimonas phyllosphaerae]|uniref:hypothetical protein n=1 Tax=Aureimonas phyllosphaerae TaxID=1166078 RepID=UPI003A5C4929
MLLKSHLRPVAPWETWFAWFPVMAFTGDAQRPYRRVWLADICRRRHHRGDWQYKLLLDPASGSELQPQDESREPQDGGKG